MAENDIELLLNQFKSAYKMFNLKIFNLVVIDQYAFTAFLKTDRTKTPRKILLTAITHGDEIGGLAAILGCAQSFAKASVEGVSVTFALGNVPAAQIGKRFIERDLNRSFNNSYGEQKEHTLARRLEKMIDQADYCIDFHQTVQASEKGFLLFPFNQHNLDFAKSIAGPNAIVTYWGAFSEDGCTLGGYAEAKKKIGVTFEMGQIGISFEQGESAVQIFKSALKYLEGDPKAVAPDPEVYTFSNFKVLSLNQMALVEGLKNFTPVWPGQTIARNAETEIKLEEHGFILFPKYGELAKVSSELCRIVRIASRKE